MRTKTIIVNVSWSGDNFCCSWEDWQGGLVVVTAKSLECLKADFKEALDLHVEGCKTDGDDCPEYLLNGQYQLDFQLDAAALIQNAGKYTTIATISKISGINPKQLSHYANGVKHPRPIQLQRIKTALFAIGTQLIAMS